MAQPHNRKTARIHLESNNVVLTQVFPALHFDHDQADDARIFQAVLVSGRDKGRFVGVDVQLPLAVHHLAMPLTTTNARCDDGASAATAMRPASLRYA